MTIAHELDTLEGLQEPVKALYIKDESTNKFRFNPDAAVSSVMALLGKRDELLGEKRKFKDVAGVLEGRNLTPEQLKEILDGHAQKTVDAQKAAGNFEALRESLVKDYEGKLAKSKEREASLLSAVQKLLVTAEATRLLADPELKGEASLLLPHIEQQARAVEENGQFRVQVFDPASGNERFASGAAMTLKALIQEMKNDTRFARAFDGTGSSGSGAPAQGAQGRTTKNGVRQVASRAELRNAAEKSAYIDAFGLEAFKALPMSAPKA